VFRNKLAALVLRGTCAQVQSERPNPTKKEHGLVPANPKKNKLWDDLCRRVETNQLDLICSIWVSVLLDRSQLQHTCSRTSLRLSKERSKSSHNFRERFFASSIVSRLVENPIETLRSAASLGGPTTGPCSDTGAGFGERCRQGDCDNGKCHHH
jgi:hypothetical protein